MADEDREPDLFAAAREPPPRALTRLSPLLRRLVAPNPSPFTFNGTCTYIVGRGAVAIVDPGPDDDSHHEAILAAVDGEKVETILVTHTHRDHSPGALRDGSRRPISTYCVEKLRLIRAPVADSLLLG